ncbi:Uncharacterized protein HZ326_19351 [Fusarium oxysporum f. sp. albedinis]|nr:Uncharacterized protein HZ326_19351 [Fusarium oxysporum f. sp. albedinis]
MACLWHPVKRSVQGPVVQSICLTGGATPSTDDTAPLALNVTSWDASRRCLLHYRKRKATQHSLFPLSFSVSRSCSRGLFGA